MRQALQAEDCKDFDDEEEEVRAANPESTNNNAPDGSQDEGLLTQENAEAEEGDDDNNEERDDQTLGGNDQRLSTLADNDNFNFETCPPPASGQCSLMPRTGLIGRAGMQCCRPSATSGRARHGLCSTVTAIGPSASCDAQVAVCSSLRVVMGSHRGAHC